MSRIVFTNGCFDLFHPGHLFILKEAKKLGDELYVGINSDASVKRLKGNKRPILNSLQRKEILKSIRYVDHVHIFYEDTPYELIKIIKPDIIVKGGDYKAQDVVGSDLAKVVIIPLINNCSTTEIIKKVRNL